MEHARKMNDPGVKLKDADLLERAMMGDRAAREELARACLPRVRRTVMLTSGRSAETDDLAQTALARIFASLERFRGDAQFTTWIDRITINTVKEFYRRRPLVSLFKTDDYHACEPAPEIEGPSRRVESTRLANSLVPHLMSIKPKKRMALILSTAYGYSVSEIAEMTDCTVETAKKRLQHGRREILEKLRKDSYLLRVFKETLQ